MVDTTQAMKTLIEVTTAKVICVCCAFLKGVTTDEDAFANAAAGAVCLVCSLAAGKESYEYFKTSLKKSNFAFGVCKNSAKVVNKIAQAGEQYFGDKC